MKPDSFEAIGRYHNTRPHARMVRTQKAVLDHMAGSWHLREGRFGYELVHNHPRFGECIRRVPMVTVTRLIKRNLVCYEDPNSDTNTWLVLTGDGSLKQAQQTR